LAKTFVINQPDGDRTPFLRGILVQSLVNSGLTFDDAYELAQEMRHELRDLMEIPARELKSRVAALLEQRFGPKQRLGYEAKPPADTEITIHTEERDQPFSVGMLAHSLEACAIHPATALDGARKVLEVLRGTGHREIDHKTLRHITYEYLRDHCSARAAKRYLSWRAFERSATPLILLIGGATGTGKSTVASELGFRLNIARVQSTDMMREIIRAYLTPQAAPTLGYSSFDAWRGLPAPVAGSAASDDPVVDGFLSQFATMKPALQATIGRAVEEQQDLIVEGVHILPTRLDLEQANNNALVVAFKLATLQIATLSAQLRRRSRENPLRAGSRHLQHVDDIWNLQAYLLDEADTAGVPIISSPSIEDTMREVLDLISDRISRRFPAATHPMEPG